MIGGGLQRGGAVRLQLRTSGGNQTPTSRTEAVRALLSVWAPLSVRAPVQREAAPEGPSDSTG